MQKNECMHLHRLLVLVLEHAYEQNDVPRSAFERYRDRHVKPSSAHRSKQHHAEAVAELASTLAETVDAGTEQSTPRVVE
ncbi:UPF0058 family protein [Haloplanus halobius]|uniref:UPF0058 family protein n=1 Tax=Haloplanus halobius TaxID=2934938 RepID=UPI00200F77ED|nr:UPF0058 family protein [Haloplanus sp. XH21]